MAEDELTQDDYRQLAAFRHAIRRFTGFSAAAAREAGLTPNQHQALLAVKGSGEGEMSVGALSAQLLVAPHTAAELVGRLEAAGLVDKIEDAGDRRRVVLRLTTRAEDILRTLTLVHRLAPRLMTIFSDLDALLG